MAMAATPPDDLVSPPDDLVDEMPGDLVSPPDDLVAAADEPATPTNLWRDTAEAFTRGLKHNLAQTARAASGRAFAPAPAAPETQPDNIDRLMQQKWSLSRAAIPKFAGEVGSSGSALAGAALGATAGAAVPVPGASVFGGVVGATLGSYLPELTSAFQSALGEGKSHEEAVDFAFRQAGIAGAFGGAGAVIPALKTPGIKNAIADFLIKNIVAQPALGVGQYAAQTADAGKPVDLEGMQEAAISGVVTGLGMEGATRGGALAGRTVKDWVLPERNTLPPEAGEKPVFEPPKIGDHVAFTRDGRPVSGNVVAIRDGSILVRPDHAKGHQVYSETLEDFERYRVAPKGEEVPNFSNMPEDELEALAQANPHIRERLQRERGQVNLPNDAAPFENVIGPTPEQYAANYEAFMRQRGELGTQGQHALEPIPNETPEAYAARLDDYLRKINVPLPQANMTLQGEHVISAIPNETPEAYAQRYEAFMRQRGALGEQPTPGAEQTTSPQRHSVASLIRRGLTPDQYKTWYNRFGAKPAPSGDLPEGPLPPAPPKVDLLTPPDPFTPPGDVLARDKEAFDALTARAPRVAAPKPEALPSSLLEAIAKRGVRKATGQTDFVSAKDEAAATRAARNNDWLPDEKAAREWSRARPGRRHIYRDDGLPPDKLYAALAEEGYLGEAARQEYQENGVVDTDRLSNLIAQELAGRPYYGDNTDVLMAERRQAEERRGFKKKYGLSQAEHDKRSTQARLMGVEPTDNGDPIHADIIEERINARLKELGLDPKDPDAIARAQEITDADDRAVFNMRGKHADLDADLPPDLQTIVRSVDPGFDPFDMTHWTDERLARMQEEARIAEQERAADDQRYAADEAAYLAMQKEGRADGSDTATRVAETPSDRSAETGRVPESRPDNVPDASAKRPISFGYREAEVPQRADVGAGERGAGERAVASRKKDVNEQGRRTVDITPEGEQQVFPGTEQSAVQAAKARGDKLKPKAPQDDDPGGMFTPKPKPDAEPGLAFDDPPPDGPIKPGPKLTSGIDPEDVAELGKKSIQVVQKIWRSTDRQEYWKRLAKSFDPMHTADKAAQIAATDMANFIRAGDFMGNEMVTTLTRTKLPRVKAMWEAADAGSVEAQKLMDEGLSRAEAMAHVLSSEGAIGKLPRDERIMLEQMHNWAEQTWAALRTSGKVRGEGLPFWTPRLAVMLADDGEFVPLRRKDEKGVPTAYDAIGANKPASSPSLKHRKYLTAEETLEAAREINPTAELKKDIRVLPDALARLNRVLAVHRLVKNLQDVGRATGIEIIREDTKGSEGEWVRFEHPAFSTYRPERIRVLDPSTGEPVVDVHGEPMWTDRKDQYGRTVLERTPMWVRKEYIGALEATFERAPSDIYKWAMNAKNASMAMIMWTPLTHRMVEWGRAFGTHPRDILTGRLVNDGRRLGTDMPYMLDAIEHGLVPIKGHSQKWDWTDGVRMLNEGQGISGWLAGKGGDALDYIGVPAPGEGWGVESRRAVDRLWDTWHNKFLWDWVFGLQVGLYEHTKNQAIQDGHAESAAKRIATHVANRYAGAIANESTSPAFRRFANIMLFSRMFTMGNLGVMKDAAMGMPDNIRYQIERDVGKLEAGKASAYLRKFSQKAMVKDYIYMALLTSLAGSTVAVMLNARDDEDGWTGALGKEARGYGERFIDVLRQGAANPFEVLFSPFETIGKLTKGGQNEPGKEHHIRITPDRLGDDEQQHRYVQVPMGKVPEEMVKYVTEPAKILKAKLNVPIGRALEWLVNADSFGRPIYNPRTGEGQWLSLFTHIAKGMANDSLWDTFDTLINDKKERPMAAAALALQAAGFRMSKGMPGGDVAAHLNAMSEEARFHKGKHYKAFRRLVNNEDFDAAAKLATERMGMTPESANKAILNMLDPSRRIKGSDVRRAQQRDLRIDGGTESGAKFQRWLDRQEREAQTIRP